MTSIKKQESAPVLGNIHSVESFGSADGPGVRYIVFLKGCAMRCKYCHNPDTWAGQGEDWQTPEEVLNKALRYKNYWKKNGGITVSGGEALLQIDFVTELFRLAKEKGVNTCLDTSGNPFTRQEPFFGKFRKLMEVTDLFMLDIKHIDPEEHQKLCSQPNAPILACARYLSDIHLPVWIRHVVVPGITQDPHWLYETGRFIGTLNNVKALDVLPYHDMGKIKYEKLGMDYPLKDTPPLKKEEAMAARKIILEGIRASKLKQ